MNSDINIVVAHCPMCGAPVNTKDRKCDYCGASLILLSGTDAVTNDPALLNGSMNKWKETLKTNPNDGTANYALGMVYMHTGLQDAAINHLRKAVENEPEFSLAHYNLSLLLFNDGYNPLDSAANIESSKEMDLAVLTNPDFSEATGFQHFFKALKLQNTDADGAIKEYAEAIDRSTDIPIFYNNLGMLYFKYKNYTEAETFIKYAADLDEKCTAAYSNLALLYATTERYDEGITYAEKGIANLRNSIPDTSKAKIYSNYGLCLLKAGRKDEALSNFQQAKAYDPAQPIYGMQAIQAKAACFIATATMGSYEHPVVMELRKLRDNWILKKSWGQKFVDSYYKHSPRYSEKISNSKISKTVSYCLIVLPLYCISKMIFLSSRTHGY